MNGHIEETRLHDHVENLLADDVAHEVEEHLAACAECRDNRAALEQLLSEVADLPVEATPSRDLWPDVRARMKPDVEPGVESVAAEDNGVIPLMGRGASGSRRISFSMGQLLAASIALAFISGGVVWMVLNGGANASGVTIASDVPVTSSVVTAASTASGQYEQAIASLESVLEQGKGLLDPETLATIEGSLRIVNEAIDEARQALESDPNNDLLNRLLIQNQQSKLRVLRQASAAVQI
jgi:anti-sigma factor RsiW